jgi:hypothetical protein
VCQSYSDPILRQAQRRSRRGDLDPEARASGEAEAEGRAPGGELAVRLRSGCYSSNPPPTSPWVWRRCFLRRSLVGEGGQGGHHATGVGERGRRSLVRRRRVHFSFQLVARHNSGWVPSQSRGGWEVHRQWHLEKNPSRA